MPAPTDIGPDLVIAGSARSGTSFLASAIGSHRHVDPGAVKESNYFSRELHRGPAWYDALYSPRRDGLLRLDGSMSYTFKHFPNALDELVETSPRVHVVYSVRHPLQRMLSHYLLHARYFENEPARSLGEALTVDGVYFGASDYGYWLARLGELLPPDQVTVVPFPVITERSEEVLSTVLGAVGLDSTLAPEGQATHAHQNQVVQFRSAAFKHARRAVRRWGLYPQVRRAVGNDRLRKLRNLLTRPVPRESLEDALLTCSPDQLSAMRQLYAGARQATGEVLRRQDLRLGLQWADAWESECPVEPWDTEVVA